jgi:hypothetical protein
MNQEDIFRAAIEHNLEGINGSVAFISLYSDGMKNIRDDPWPAVQLGISILLEKPIILAVLAGRTPPPKLLAIADAVVYADDAFGLAQGIKDATERLAGPL